MLDAMREEIVTLRREVAKRDGTIAALSSSIRSMSDENARLRQRCDSLATVAGADACV